MKSLIGQCLCICMLVTTVVSPASAEGAEPQLVADEFREALARISVATSAKPPEAVDFPPQVARFVRVLIHETSGDSQPCIDELEILGPEGTENLALVKRGAVASASSVLAGYAIHAIEHLNDGRYGNDHSWIAATGGREWAQIELPEPATVASVVVTRDRSGQYRDRIPEVFEVLVSTDGEHWQSVAGETAPQPTGLAGFPICRSTGCPSRAGTVCCSTHFFASERRGAPFRPTTTCRLCWSIGQLSRADRRTGVASPDWSPWSGHWCSSRR